MRDTGLFGVVADLKQHACLDRNGFFTELDASRVLEGRQRRGVLRLGELHQLGSLTCDRVVDQALPTELGSLQSILEVGFGRQLLRCRVLHVVLLEADVVTVDASPDEVDDERQRLREQLSPNDADVAEESAVALCVSRINMNAG